MNIILWCIFTVLYIYIDKIMYYIVDITVSFLPTGAGDTII